MLSLTSRIHEHCEKGNRSIAISRRKQLPGKEYTEMQGSRPTFCYQNYGSIAIKIMIYPTKNKPKQLLEMVNISKDPEKKFLQFSQILFWNISFLFFFFVFPFCCSFCSLSFLCFLYRRRFSICFNYFIPNISCSSVLNKL